MDASKNFLKLFNFPFEVLVVGTHFELLSVAAFVSMLLEKTTANENTYLRWYFYGILLFQLLNVYVLQVHVRKVAYHLFLFHM